MKRFKVSTRIYEWLMSQSEYLEKKNNYFILNSGYFSGDSIPIELQRLLRKMYDENGPIKVELVH